MKLAGFTFLALGTLCLFPGRAVATQAPLIELSDATFDKVMKEHENVLVEYYAPWCGYCKKLKPELEALAEALIPQAKKIAIAAYNCDETANAERCKALNLRGYPSVFLYRNGVDEATRTADPSPQEIADDTERTVNGLTQFLVSSIRTLKSPLQKTVSPVLQLTSQNYEVVLKNKYALVKFATEWCGYCKQLKPIYEQLAGVFQGDQETVAIAEVDCTKEQALCDHYDVQGYPTLKFFDHSLVDAVRYNAGRDVDSMISFINSQCNLARNSDGTLSPDYARNATLDAIVVDFMKNKEARTSLLSKIEGVLTKDAPETSRYYATFMRRVLDKGDTYPTVELARLTDIVSKGGLDPKKLDGFTIRMNILKVFTGEAGILMEERDEKLSANDVHEEL